MKNTDQFHSWKFSKWIIHIEGAASKLTNFMLRQNSYSFAVYGRGGPNVTFPPEFYQTYLAPTSKSLHFDAKKVREHPSSFITKFATFGGANWKMEEN